MNSLHVIHFLKFYYQVFHMQMELVELILLKTIFTNPRRKHGFFSFPRFVALEMKTLKIISAVSKEWHQVVVRTKLWRILAENLRIPICVRPMTAVKSVASFESLSNENVFCVRHALLHAASIFRSIKKSF